MLIRTLCERWPDIFGEPPAQRAANMSSHQKPDSMSWEDWCDYRRPGYFAGYECHWYDPWYGREKNTRSNGGCSGGTRHNHQPRLMAWYWNPWTTVLTWPIMLADGIAEWVHDRRWFHRYVLKHTVTRHDARRPTRVTPGGIAIYEQNTFHVPVKHDRCSCGEIWSC